MKQSTCWAGAAIALAMPASANITFDSGTFSTNATFNATFDLEFLSACPWDCQATPNGAVDVPDLLALLATWGSPGPCDFDASGTVVVPDLLKLLANWGACP